MTSWGMVSPSQKRCKPLFVPVTLFSVAWFLIWALSVVPNDFFLLTFLALAATGVTVSAFVTGWSRLNAES
jgi:hypothetical protein